MSFLVLFLQASEHERLLKDFNCGLCKGVLKEPISLPCGHNYCKGCLDTKFAELPELNQPTNGNRPLRARKVRLLALLLDSLA
jgi:E3 ubiquitin-protein ligase UHRF1